VNTVGVAVANSKLLRNLNLRYNYIDDEGLDVLTSALMHSSMLQTLSLAGNPITTRGWKALSTLLTTPNSSLEELDISHTNLDDDGALIFASALANNCKLKKFWIYGNTMSVTAKGWLAFSHLLCETSSVNKTFLSNHTLRVIQECIVRGPEKPDDVKSFLTPNESDDKKQVAITKILKHHSEINMQPLFEWDFKRCHLSLAFSKRANACPQTSQMNINSKKLSAIYQFIQCMPSLLSLG